jgi:hypothetical protein
VILKSHALGSDDEKDDDYQNKEAKETRTKRKDKKKKKKKGDNMYREFFQFSSGSDGSGGEESDLEEMYHEIEVRDQGVIKRCCLSWLTNSALVYEPKCGGGGEGVVAGSQQMIAAVH